ncbi:hypothetical protein COBT_000094 [Conglomerata obtusa]
MKKPPIPPKEYLKKGFDYRKLTKPQMIHILQENRVTKIPFINVKKDKFFNLYEANIVAKREELMQAWGFKENDLVDNTAENNNETKKADANVSLAGDTLEKTIKKEDVDMIENRKKSKDLDGLMIQDDEKIIEKKFESARIHEQPYKKKIAEDYKKIIEMHEANKNKATNSLTNSSNSNDNGLSSRSILHRNFGQNENKMSFIKDNVIKNNNIMDDALNKLKKLNENEKQIGGNNKADSIAENVLQNNVALKKTKTRSKVIDSSESVSTSSDNDEEIFGTESSSTNNNSYYKNIKNKSENNKMPLISISPNMKTHKKLKSPSKFLDLVMRKNQNNDKDPESNTKSSINMNANSFVAGKNEASSFDNYNKTFDKHYNVIANKNFDKNNKNIKNLDYKISSDINTSQTHIDPTKRRLPERKQLTMAEKHQIARNHDLEQSKLNEEIKQRKYANYNNEISKSLLETNINNKDKYIRRSLPLFKSQEIAANISSNNNSKHQKMQYKEIETSLKNELKDYKDIKDTKIKNISPEKYAINKKINDEIFNRLFKVTNCDTSQIKDNSINQTQINNSSFFVKHLNLINRKFMNKKIIFFLGFILLMILYQKYLCPYCIDNKIICIRLPERAVFIDGKIKCKNGFVFKKKIFLKNCCEKDKSIEVIKKKLLREILYYIRKKNMEFIYGIAKSNKVELKSIINIIKTKIRNIIEKEKKTKINMKDIVAEMNKIINNDKNTNHAQINKNPFRNIKNLNINEFKSHHNKFNKEFKVNNKISNKTNSYNNNGFDIEEKINIYIEKSLVHEMLHKNIDLAVENRFIYSTKEFFIFKVVLKYYSYLVMEYLLLPFIILLLIFCAKRFISEHNRKKSEKKKKQNKIVKDISDTLLAQKISYERNFVEEPFILVNQFWDYFGCDDDFWDQIKHIIRSSKNIKEYVCFHEGSHEVVWEWVGPLIGYNVMQNM